jgi:hypothetical protein
VPKNGAGRSTGSINFVISAIHITNFRRLSLAPSRLCLCVCSPCVAVLSFDILMDWPWLIVSWEKCTLIALSENEKTGAA